MTTVTRPLSVGSITIYYPTALGRVQITPKTSTNITRYLYSIGLVRQDCLVLLLLTNQLAGFNTPIPFRFAYFSHAFPVNKYPRNSPHGNNNLACWIINLLLHVLLCSIAENFFALRARQNTAQLVKILSDTTQQNV